jgi:hypothetical protein
MKFGMEATHAAYPIRQQTVPDGTALFVEPLIHRGLFGLRSGKRSQPLPRSSEAEW